MEKYNPNTVMAIFFVTIAIMFIAGLAVIPALELQQEVEARPVTPTKSCDFAGRAFNASEGRCFHP